MTPSNGLLNVTWSLLIHCCICMRLSPIYPWHASFVVIHSDFKSIRLCNNWTKIQSLLAYYWRFKLHFHWRTGQTASGQDVWLPHPITEWAKCLARIYINWVELPYQLWGSSLPILGTIFLLVILLSMSAHTCPRNLWSISFYWLKYLIWLKKYLIWPNLTKMMSM